MPRDPKGCLSCEISRVMSARLPDRPGDLSCQLFDEVQQLFSLHIRLNEGGGRRPKSSLCLQASPVTRNCGKSAR